MEETKSKEEVKLFELATKYAWMRAGKLPGESTIEYDKNLDCRTGPSVAKRRGLLPMHHLLNTNFGNLGNLMSSSF